MALFAFQLIRLVFFLLEDSDYTDFAIVIDQMLNVIIKSVHFCFFCFTDNIYQGIVPTIILVLVSMKLSFDDTESFKEAAGSLHLNNPPSDPNTSSIMITTTVTTSDQWLGLGPYLVCFFYHHEANMLSIDCLVNFQVPVVAEIGVQTTDVISGRQLLGFLVLVPLYFFFSVFFFFFFFVCPALIFV